jgi:hypothetical protein
MFARHITVEDVRRTIERGDVIDVKPDDLPYPSRLVLAGRAVVPCTSCWPGTVPPTS